MAVPDLAKDIERLIEDAKKRRHEADNALAAGDAATGARLIRQAAAMEEAARLLRAGDHSGTSNSMVPAARSHISAGRSKGAPANMKSLQAMASLTGHTLRSLAKAAEAETGKPCPHNIVSRALHGTRPIRRSAAKAIQKLTRSKQHPAGFEASEANWPGGWSDGD